MIKYWDYVNGRVTDDSSFAEIIDSGNSYLYIETYKIFGNARIDIAYTQEQKDNENLYLLRESVCKQHNIKLNFLEKLLYLAVPTEVYKKIYKEE